MITLNRSILNHNPLNIDRIPSNPWHGEITAADNPGFVDPRFCQFISAPWGIRAGILNFQAGQDRHGCSTWLALIRRQAPEVENDTSAYAANVQRSWAATGNDVNNSCDTHSWQDMQAFARACIIEECGAIYPDEVWTAVQALLGSAVQ